MAQEPVKEDVSGSLQYLVVNRIARMNDAKANGEEFKYFIYFKFSTQLLMPYMSKEDRVKLQADFIKLTEYEAELSETQEGISLSKAINSARYIFADNREYYIMNGLGKTGIIRVMEEGTIDFNKADAEKLRSLIVGGGGLITGAENYASKLATQ